MTDAYRSTTNDDDELLARIRPIGVIPVVQLPDPSMALALADVLAGAGLPAIEVTFRAAGAASAIAAIRAARPEMLVAAGTVLTIDQADEALDAGAELIVAPGTNPTVVAHVLRRGGRIMPGVATPSEIEANLERRISLLKFFPAEALGGPAFLRSVHGPFPSAAFVPSGGIGPSNLAAYLTLPNVPAVGGTWIASVKALAAGDLDEVERQARAAVAAVRAARDAAPT